MPTEEMTRRRTLERRIEALENKADHLSSELEDLNDELEDLRKQYPELPEVMRFGRGEHVWFTDGWRAVRGGWPVEFANRDADGLEKSGPGLIDDWQAIDAPVTAIEAGDCYDGEVVILSNGAYLNREMFEELTPGGDWTLHSDDPRKAAVWKNGAGEVVAAQMPRSIVEVKNRRPYARPAETACACKRLWADPA